MNFGHHRLSVFGIADEEELALVKPVARALLARDALRADDFGGLSFGPGAKPILKGEREGRDRAAAEADARAATARRANIRTIRCSRRCARGAASLPPRRACRPTSSSTTAPCARWRRRSRRRARLVAHLRRRRSQAGALWRRLRQVDRQLGGGMSFRILDERTLVSPADRTRRRRRRESGGRDPDRQQPPRRRGAGPAAGAEIEAAARAAGLDYRHIPVREPADAGAGRGDGTGAGGERGPYARLLPSGTRSTFAWALARAREGADGEELIGKAAAAGYDLAPLRPYLG